MMSRYEITLTEAHPLTEGDETTLTIDGYDDVGSMLMLELTDGSTQSIGKQLVDDVAELEE
jgi:hypothetical protein